MTVRKGHYREWHTCLGPERLLLGPDRLVRQECQRLAVPLTTPRSFPQKGSAATPPNTAPFQPAAGDPAGLDTAPHQEGLYGRIWGGPGSRTCSLTKPSISRGCTERLLVLTHAPPHQPRHPKSHPVQVACTQPGATGVLDKHAGHKPCAAGTHAGLQAVILSENHSSCLAHARHHTRRFQLSEQRQPLGKSDEGKRSPQGHKPSLG